MEGKREGVWGGALLFVHFVLFFCVHCFFVCLDHTRGGGPFLPLRSVSESASLEMLLFLIFVILQPREGRERKEEIELSPWVLFQSRMGTRGRDAPITNNSKA